MNIIETANELATFCHHIESIPILSLDTEFVGEGRYYPELGAIQIAAGDEVALIDPLSVDDLSPLLELLLDTKIVKVLHASGQDLAIFYRLFGKPAEPVFDVQVAAALLGYGDQVSLLQLLQQILEIRLVKGHSFTNWLHRPFTQKQIEYAVEDVKYLAALYKHLQKNLQEKDRWHWAQEEFAQYADALRYEPADAREVFRRIKGAERLKGKELALLQELAAWREETARRKNTHPGRICMDEVLLTLARHPHFTKENLHEVRGLKANQIERYGDQIIEALIRGAENPHPILKRPRMLPSHLEPAVDFLVLCLRALASEAGVSSGILANRSDLTAIVQYGEHAEVPLMRGWRREAFGNTILETLQGKATARILPDTRQVHIDWSHDPSTTIVDPS